MGTKLRFGLLLVLIMVAFGTIDSQSKISSEEILNLVNSDRAKQGLSPLSINPSLSLAAFAKAEDMLSRKYFAHIAPDGTKPWFWMKSLGYNYVYAGENLASGFEDAQELQKSWMSSPTHRANILSPFYSDTGVAVIEKNNSVIIVQFFGNETGQVTLRQ
jgi:uncharacterized protein YkwD